MNYLKRLIIQTLSVACLVLAAGCSSGDLPQNHVIRGTADLRDGRVYSSVVELNGEWEFYPGRFLAPGEFNDRIRGERIYLKVPGDWGSIQKAKGFGTYRLKVRLPDDYTQYSLKLIWVKSVAKVWVDQKLLLQQGEIMDPVEKSVPGDYISIVDFRPVNPDFFITIHVANYHDRRGGLCFPVSIGTPDVMYGNEMKLTFINTLIIGALVIVILFHIALQFYFRTLSLNLYVSLICCMVMTRIFILTDSIYIFSFVRSLGYTLLVKIEFAGLVLVFIFLLQFFTRLYVAKPGGFLKRILFWSGIASIVYIAVMPVFFIKEALPFFQLYLLAVTVFLIAFPLRAGVRAGVSGARIYFAIIVLALLAFINDIIYFLTSRGFPNITGYAFFFVLVGHFIVLSIYFANLFQSNISLVKDIGLKNKVVAKLSLLSSTDSLTGLFNRRFFDNYLSGRIRDFKKGETIWLVLFDIDFFKKVNDNFGHNKGDLVLKDISNLVRGLIRTGDVLCRWGGEEFAIVISGMDKNGIAQFTERIRESVEAFRFPVARSITASFGVASLSYGETAADFIRRADEAMYGAKESGRNRVVFAAEKRV